MILFLFWWISSGVTNNGLFRFIGFPPIFAGIFPVFCRFPVLSFLCSNWCDVIWDRSHANMKLSRMNNTPNMTEFYTVFSRFYPVFKIHLLCVLFPFSIQRIIFYWIESRVVLWFLVVLYTTLLLNTLFNSKE